MSNILAVMFDVGGVLFENGTKKVIEFLHNQYSLDKKILYDIYCGEKSWELRKGKLTAKAYWHDVYIKYKFLNDLQDLDLEILWYDSYVIRYNLMALVKKLNKKYRLGIISGNIRERVKYLEEKYKFSQYFNFSIYSYEYGCSKIDNLLYQKARDLLKVAGISTYQALFIDDNQDCVERAESIGFKAILFSNYPSLLKNIHCYGLDSF